MKEHFDSMRGQASDDLYGRMEFLIRNNPRTWQSIGAVSGLGVGILTPFLGALLTISTWFIHSPGAITFLNILSIISFVLTIPLLAFGAHCLDLLEAKTASLPTPVEPLSVEAISGVVGAQAIQRNGKRRINRVLATILLLIAAHATVNAQQTVFNVPTTDVLDPGQVYFELDISAKPVDPKFSSFVPRLVIGAGGRVEVGLNVTGNIQPGADTTTLVPAVKWKVYDGGDNGWAIAVGNNLYIPVRNKSYDLGTYSYAMVQRTFRTKTRVGFGGYFFSKNVVAPNANRAGGQFTFEQPVTGKFGVQADWFTGKHANGYFTPGGYYKFNKKLTGYAAYSIGNAGVTNGNHFLYFEMGYNF